MTCEVVESVVLEELTHEREEGATGVEGRVVTSMTCEVVESVVLEELVHEREDVPHAQRHALARQAVDE